MQTLAEFYIKRNVFLIKQWLKLTGGGMKVREAAKVIAEQNEGVTPALMQGIVYTKDYPYAAQAWEVIHKEEAEREKKAKAKEAKKETGA